MQNILGPVQVNPIASTMGPISQQLQTNKATMPVTTTIKSPTMLLEQLTKGGTITWKGMSPMEQKLLINTYGYGNKELFLKFYKQSTWKYLDIRTDANPHERLNSNQIRGFIKAIGGSVLGRPPIESIKYRGTRTHSSRKAKDKAKTQKRKQQK